MRQENVCVCECVSVSVCVCVCFHVLKHLFFPPKERETSSNYHEYLITALGRLILTQCPWLLRPRCVLGLLLPQYYIFRGRILFGIFVYCRNAQFQSFKSCSLLSKLDLECEDRSVLSQHLMRILTGCCTLTQGMSQFKAVL